MRVTGRMGRASVALSLAATVLSAGLVDPASQTLGFDPLELDRYSSIQQFSRALAETANDVQSIQSLLDTLAQMLGAPQPLEHRGEWVDARGGRSFEPARPDCGGGRGVERSRECQLTVGRTTGMSGRHSPEAP